MSTASFRFADPLSFFVAPAYRGRPFLYDCAHAATLKNAIEAFGVPHTEAGTVTVNGEPATLQRAVRDGDEIDVAAYRYDGSEPLVFLADAHLGGDPSHRPRGEPRRPDARPRITDVPRRRAGMLRPGDPSRGAVGGSRGSLPAAEEGAAAHALPVLQRSALESFPKEKAAGRVPERVLELHDAFTHCSACGRIYWPGTHYERMKKALESVRNY